MKRILGSQEIPCTGPPAFCRSLRSYVLVFLCAVRKKVQQRKEKKSTTKSIKKIPTKKKKKKKFPSATKEEKKTQEKHKSNTKGNIRRNEGK